MKKLYWSIIINFFLFNQIIYAQKIELEQKKVGILISRKNLFIDGYQAKFWASYLQINDSLGLSEENLKTAVTIKLGQLYTQWFKEYLNVSEVYFLNEGKKFENVVKNYPFHEKPLLYVPLDYIFCIDPIQLFSKKEKVVFTLSNKLFSEYQTKMQIKGKISVYSMDPFQIIKQDDFQIDDTIHYNKPIPVEKFNFKIEKLIVSWLNRFFI